MDTRGLQLYYCSQLKCVHELKQQLSDPSSETSLFMKCNLVNLMAFYAKLEYTTSEQSQGAPQYAMSENRMIMIENNILAAEFIKIVCQLWQF